MAWTKQAVNGIPESMKRSFGPDIFVEGGSFGRAALGLPKLG
jgi:hypothetical protein